MKDPAFLFYPGDYLRDTQCLSEKSQVAYDRLMCEHMRNICISKQQLNFFTKRLTDNEKAELMFLLTEIKGGYEITWVAESICKRREYSDSRRKNRKKPNLSHDKDMFTYDEHMENENENESDNEDNIVIEKKEKKIIVPFAEIVEAYNSICISLPKCSKLTEERKKKIKQRWNEMERDMSKITELFTKTEQSDFCTGKVKEWTANFDWLFENSKNWVKVVEGNYDNKIVPTKAADHDRYHSDFASDLEERWLGKKSGMA